MGQKWSKHFRVAVVFDKSESAYELYYDKTTVILCGSRVHLVVVEFKAKVSESETFSMQERHNNNNTIFMLLHITNVPTVHCVYTSVFSSKHTQITYNKQGPLVFILLCLQ